MAASPEPALTVIAWGNESRGDDGIGPVLARRIENLGNAGIDIVEDFQLNIEHVMDLRENVPVLFIDASAAIEPGYRVERLVPRRDDSITTHSVSPQALLALYEQTLGRPAPDAYLLHVCGRSFELGDALCDATVRSVDLAWDYLSTLFAMPRDRWSSGLEAAIDAT